MPHWLNYNFPDFVIAKNVLGKTYIQCVSSNFEMYFVITIIQVNIHRFLPPEFQQFICFQCLYFFFLKCSYVLFSFSFFSSSFFLSRPHLYTLNIFAFILSFFVCVCASTHCKLPYEVWAFRIVKNDLFFFNLEIFFSAFMYS